MRAYVLQLAAQMLWGMVAAGLIAIGIGHIGEGNGQTLQGYILYDAHGAILVARRLCGDAIRGLELEIIVSGRIGRLIAIVNGVSRRGRVRASHWQQQQQREQQQLELDRLRLGRIHMYT